MRDDLTADILVAGAGAAGLALALALAQAGHRTVLAGPPDRAAPGRTVALLHGSANLLRNLGVWPALEPLAAPLATMRLCDDTGSLFALPPVDFSAREIGLPAFGHNIANDDLVAALLAQAAATPGLVLVGERLAAIRVGDSRVEAATGSGIVLRARLLAAADGRDSLARAAAGIAVRRWTYPQEALTAVLAHARPHRNVSTEFHTREGPCTLVPLPPREGAPHRSSLVWLMAPARAEEIAALDEAAFCEAAGRQSHFLNGAILSAAGRGRFPMSGLAAARMAGPRTALVGEAAHVFPPIGAQGLNLGLRDVACLAACLRRGADPGAKAALAAFEAARRADVATRSGAVDLLNRSLLAGLLPVDLLRGAGLAAIAHLPPLRRAIIKAGLMPADVPPLMRDPAA